jgi:hypothetical protein
MVTYQRAVWGSNFAYSILQPTSIRNGEYSINRDWGTGVRCARAP